MVVAQGARETRHGETRVRSNWIADGNKLWSRFPRHKALPVSRLTSGSEQPTILAQ
jgi:hypothetical protein